MLLPLHVCFARKLESFANWKSEQIHAKFPQSSWIENEAKDTLTESKKRHEV